MMHYLYNFIIAKVRQVYDIFNSIEKQFTFEQILAFTVFHAIILSLFFLKRNKNKERERLCVYSIE